ncbi:Aste57867_13130 [Aphanomyces stellatus]|uniref:histone deacetylase n=1 Tax=Aphanomyces stellatus TaxID=120398 RepID=A0A485KXT0_9STRA|nr:hypothetical protein As57867_013081 [Aphanomyces stellatus]VFT89972.1 Aste57867_13130 [Aphanomyces stellatus]
MRDHAMTSERLRPILSSILTTSASSSRNSTPRSTPAQAAAFGGIPPLKRRVSFTNHGEPDQPIPEKLEDLLETDTYRPPSSKQQEKRIVVRTTDLHHACSLLDVDAAMTFLNQSTTSAADIDAVSDDGYSALCLAAMAPPPSFATGVHLAKALLDRGASLVTADASGYTALHWGAALGNVALLDLFLTTQPSIVDIVATSDGETALHRAARFGHTDAIRVLVQHGASTSTCSHALLQPIDVAGLGTSTTPHAASHAAVLACFAACRPALKTLVLHHPDCNDHLTIESHQEAPARIAAILARLHDNPMLDISSDFGFASLAAVRRVHSTKYIDTLKQLHLQVQSVANGLMALTPRIQVEVQGTALDQAKHDAICDTNFSRGTLKAALRAAGGVCHAIRAVVSGTHRNAFCIVRPPGHHAGWSGLLRDATSCGFCILNTVMIGAQYALDTFPPLKKIAIVDFDAHHGNGTQDILRQQPRPNVLFISLHLFADGFYPGSGHSHDLVHNLFNFPLAPVWSGGAKDKGSVAFRARVSQVVLPLLRAFAPDLVLVSAGFDGCHHDIGNKQHGQRDGAVGLDLTPADFHWVTTQLQHMANLVCGGRLVSVLEGGYGRRNDDQDGDETSSLSPPSALVLDTLQASAHAHVQALSNQTYVDPPIKTRVSTRTPIPTHKTAKRKR